MTDANGSVYLLKRTGRPERWMIAFRDVDGKRKTRVADRQDRAGAEAHLQRVLREIAVGESVAPRHHTLATWVDEWLDIKVTGGARPRTIEAYRERLTRHVLPRLGAKALAAITPDDIQSLYSAYLRTPSKATGRRPSRTTASHIHNALRACLRTAYKRRLVGYVATERVEPPRPESYDARTLTLPEARLLLAALTTGPYRDHPHAQLWIFMLGTGTRFGEAAGLTWPHVDLGAGVARIAQQVTREREAVAAATNSRRHGNTRTRYVVRHVLAQIKTEAGKRVVALPDFVVAALRIQQTRNEAAAKRAAERAAERKAAYDTTHPDLVFPSTRGGLLHENHVLVTWHRMLRSPDIALEGQPHHLPLRMHDLRHTKGTLMADAGEDTTTIQRTLGHARQSITADLYIGSTHNEQRRAAARYADLFAPHHDKEQG